LRKDSLVAAPQLDLRAVKTKAIVSLIDDVVKSYSQIQTMAESLRNTDVVLQAYNTKVTTTTDTFNRVLMEALQAATQPGANLVAAAQTVQQRARSGPS
jgi:prefoldin subunit 5